MDNSTTYNILDKAKNDLSKSGQDITNSINTFNDNLNKVIDSINPNNQKPNFQNKDQILKTSSDMEIFKESSSLTTSINKLNNRPKQNIQIKNKIADPASDILCKKLQQKIDSLNYDNFVLNKKNKELTSNNDILNFELNKLKHNNKTEIMMFSEELDKALTNLKQKEEEISKLNEEIKSQEDNMNDYKNKYKLNKNIENENEKLRQNKKELNETIIKLQNDLKFYKNELYKVTAENEMAKKELSNKDNILFNKKNEELKEENETLKNEINELKKDKENMMNKISEYDIIKRKEYQNEMDIEKEGMEKKLKEELERIKFEQESIMDIKIKKLKEENEDLKYKIQELKNKMKSNNNDVIIEELKKQNASLNDESSYLKLQIQLKDSENSRLNNIYKENINLIGELNQENNQLKEKLNLLNNKLREISSNNLTEMAEAREKIAFLSSKAQSYEKQDNTFDKIFSEILLEDENTNTNKNEESKNMIAAINQMPQGYDKIISQCKFMASRLKKLYEEKAILNAKLENLQIENNKFKEQSNIFKNMEQNNNESYEYLLKELEKKDSELLYYREVVNDREIRFKQVMNENDNLKARCNSLEKDLKQILENRSKIDKLDYLVGRIVENQKMFFGSDKFNLPTGNKNIKSGKNQALKNNKVKFK